MSFTRGRKQATFFETQGSLHGPVASTFMPGKLLIYLVFLLRVQTNSWFRAKQESLECLCDEFTLKKTWFGRVMCTLAKWIIYIYVYIYIFGGHMQMDTKYV